MKRFGKVVIGGIESRIISLILLTVVLLTAANGAVHLYHSRMLAKLSSDSGRQQLEAIEDVTSEAMDRAVCKTLERSNREEVRIADGIFLAAKQRVTFLADYTQELLEHPENFVPRAYSGPKDDEDGTWTAKVVYANDVDDKDPVLAEKVGMLASLTDVMLSLCPAFNAANIYVALPEGVHYSVSTSSSTWLEDGGIRRFDPRVRPWYVQAVETGGIVFTEGERDANTGAYCIECAAPVYGPDGELAAVVGTDLYLNDMQKVMDESVLPGEYQLLVSRNGKAVLAPETGRFPGLDLEREQDLRHSYSELLSEVLNEAFEGSGTEVLKGTIDSGEYYITAAPIETTGWILVSAYSREKAGEAATLLQERTRQIQEESVKTYRQKTKSSAKTAAVLALFVSAGTLAGALALGKRIVRPLNLITRRIAGQSSGNLEFKMEDAFRTGDEVEELARSFASLSRMTLEYIETVKKVSAEKERMGAELTVAARIQSSMLPHIFPAFPDRSEFDVFAVMDPAREVGGDFYDYFLIDSDHLCMVIADVSGKGIPAALFMMASKIILQNTAIMGKSPAEILESANKAICVSNEAQMFVTVWLGILEISTGKLISANAGHEYPVFRRDGGDFELEKDKHGFVIGGLQDIRYREQEMQLKPGDKLFVYTDGVTEATDADNELFGTNRLLEALNADPAGSPQVILENVGKAVENFVGGAEQFDDLTMLCMEYKGLAGTEPAE